MEFHRLVDAQHRYNTEVFHRTTKRVTIVFGRPLMHNFRVMYVVMFALVLYEGFVKLNF